MFLVLSRAALSCLFSSGRRHTRCLSDWSSDVCSSDLCTFANAACARLLGYNDTSQFIGRNMHALIHHTRADGTSYPMDECRIYQGFRRGEPSHIQDEVLWRAEGSSFPAEYWSYPIRRGGEVVGSVVTFLDI